MAREVFISYSHVDKAIADAACSALENSGIACWIAPRDVLPGVTYPEQISQAISAARTCLLVLSSDSNSSRQVQSEIELAFSGGIPILPLRIEDVLPGGDLEYLLAGTHWFDALSDAPARIPELVDRVKLLLERYARAAVDEQPAPLRNAIPKERTNLPFELTELVGREACLSEVRDLLNASRLVTLTGAGGVGKTRLAVQVGVDRVNDYSDGVWIVELAAVADGSYVAPALADVLHVREIGNRPIVDALVHALQMNSMLIIFDNCEHLLDAVASLSDDLLRACSGLHILATSRQPLGVTGEEVVRVPSLSLPATTESQTAAQVESFGAIQLFVQRVRSVNRSFTLSDANAPSVAELCRRLDGIPLAIELATARLKSLSLSELMEQLSARFRILTTGSRTTLPRHQTLRALIDWSYNLLAPDEKLLFDRLGIFASSFALAAPSAVCSGNGIEERNVVDLLTSLVDKSLVAADTSGDVARFKLLESVRAYAIEHLTEDNEFVEIQNKRVSYFANFAENALQQMNEAVDAGLPSIEQNLEELRSVLDLTVAQQYDISAGARIANGLARYWHDTGKFAEAYRWYKAILEKGRDSLDDKVRASALLGAGLMCDYLDAFVEARTLLEKALVIFSELGDRAQAARCLTGLGVSANYLGQHAEAERLFNDCLAVQRELGQERGIAISLVNLGATAQQYRDDPSAAEAYFAEALVYARLLNDKPISARVLAELSLIERDRHNLNGAIELAEENLRICRFLDNRSYVAEGLCRLATLHLEENRPVTARVFLMEAVLLLVDRIDEGESFELATAFMRFAAVLAAESQWSAAAELVGFAEQLRTSAQRVEAGDDAFRTSLLDRLASQVSQDELAASISRGRTLTLAQARSLLTPRERVQ